MAKFRGKSLDNGEWIKGSLLFFDNGMASIAQSKTKVFKASNEVMTLQGVYDIDPATVGQYTGKKNLFDGDIFLAGNGKVLTLVFWNDEQGSWYVKNLRRNEIHRLDKHFDRFIDGGVIGNRWDNPELLESEAK
jgi:hypothetical protein